MMWAKKMQNNNPTIKIHNAEDLGKMRSSCILAAKTLNYIEKFVQPNITTQELNDLCHEYIISHGASPAPLNYNGFPKSICTSVNDVICHGIPSPQEKIKSGDIINIDVTVILDGYHGDTSKTFLVGECSNHAKRVVSVAQQALYEGISAVKSYGYFNDIGNAIQKYVDSQGFSVVRDYCGHGIGKLFHDAPQVLHYKNNESHIQILPGMFFTIEPMVNAGSYKTKLRKDGWTVTTVDKSLSAQFEHTIAVLEDSVEILTLAIQD